MIEKINLSVAPHPVFAGISGSTADSTFGDPIDARIRMLKKELIHFTTRIEDQGTRSVKARAQAAPSCGNAAPLREKLQWLAGKFNSSRAFPLFKAGGGNLGGNDLFGRYLAALDIDSMDQIGQTIKDANALLESLPVETRGYFTPVTSYAAYFAKVDECLKAMSRMPEESWNAMLNGAQEKSLFACLGHKNSRRACLDLLHECISLGNKLSQEIEESERQLKLVFSLVNALTNTDVSSQCKREPRAGALNSFIRATPI